MEVSVGFVLWAERPLHLAWKDGALTKAVLYDACEELEVCLVYRGEKKTNSLKTRRAQRVVRAEAA